MTMKRIFIIILAFVLLSGFRVPGFSEKHKTHAEPVQLAYQPKHIALLLPLSGKHADAARAIKEGFLAAYYETTFPGAPKPMIRLYDTAKDPDVQKTYLHAVQQGADFVVGPLTKDEVLRLSQLSLHAVKAPILALNYHPQAKMLNGKLHQFALQPESEATQLAERAWQQGHRRAGILVPHSSLGKRIADTFSQHWQLLGGQITQTVFADPRQDQSIAVRQLLSIAANQDLKENPPNPSFDMIAMTADPLQARQLKPLLNFYYAEKIPVYSTSNVYSGEPDPMTDRDLNGIVFCDMPWLIAPSRYPNFSAISCDDRRLFAMGADAYQLTTQLATLQSGKTYAGMTGDLYMNKQQIHRHLMWVKMINGIPQQLPKG